MEGGDVSPEFALWMDVISCLEELYGPRHQVTRPAVQYLGNEAIRSHVVVRTNEADSSERLNLTFDEKGKLLVYWMQVCLGTEDAYGWHDLYPLGELPKDNRLDARVGKTTFLTEERLKTALSFLKADKSCYTVKSQWAQKSIQQMLNPMGKFVRRLKLTFPALDI